MTNEAPDLSSSAPAAEIASTLAPDPVVAPAPPASIAAEPAVEPAAEAPAEPEDSFGDILAGYEREHVRRPEPGTAQLRGTIVSLTPEQVFLDIGFKVEGVLPRAAFAGDKAEPQVGDTVSVSVKGRNEEGYYELTRFRVAQPRDWSALEAAFEQKLAVVGTVTAVVKGGLTVDLGVRAFMPASRSGTRDAAELEKLVGTEITCRITKLDTADEDVVVDRRVVLEEQARVDAEGRFAALQPGDTVSGTVRSLMPYGAFIDLGGIDGLLHVSDISWARVAKPEDVLSVGQQLDVRILKIDPETRKLSLGLKQLQPEPWALAAEKYTVGQRISGLVTRVAEFGAFVEIEPGVEGLIHVSEMSWGKKVRIASDIVKPGEHVDAVILSIKPPSEEGPGRISLGLKQTLADPWAEVPRLHPVGSQIEGPVTKIMKFGAFVQIAEGIEGLVHISEIVADRRLDHPSEVLHAGQVVQAQVLAIDTAKRQIKLSMKQLIPTGMDEYLAEHAVGDTVSGRVLDSSATPVLIELGEGIVAVCAASVSKPVEAAPAPAPAGALDLSALSSQLKARWKGNAPAPQTGPAPLETGQVRSFKITLLDAPARRIEVALA